MAFGSVKVDSIVTSTKTVTVDSLMTSGDMSPYLLSSAIGTTVQGYDAQLADIAGLTPADNSVIIGNGTNFVAESGATARASLGLTIGTDIQAYDAGLAAVAALSSTGLINRTGSGTVATVSLPTGDLVGTSATQTLTAKTLTDPAIIGTILEDVFTITDGEAFEIDPGNGSIQLTTLGANRTPKATNFAAGEAVTLMVDDGSAYTLTWSDTTFGTSGVVWKTGAGAAPTLNTIGFTVIVFWKVGTQVYGARVGDA